MQSKRLDQSEVVKYWELLWGERYKLGQPLRGKPKVKGPDGNVYNLYVDTPVFNDSLNVLYAHYKPKAIKMLKRLVYRNKLRGYDCESVAYDRFHFALLRYHPSFYPKNPEGGFYPYMLNSKMVFYDCRDYKKRNVSDATFPPINDLLKDSSPDFDFDEPFSDF